VHCLEAVRSNDTIRKVKHRAIEEDISTSALVDRILEEYLNKKK
jgi:hypothetical protein